MGVRAGEGMGVGSSRMGDKHLFIFPGISSNIEGGCKRLCCGAFL